MATPGPDHLGEFEQLVLLALLHLGDEGYGMNVRREIETRTGREVTTGAVYATLDRLEGKGLVASKTADEGRVRRTFKVTAAGKKSLQATLGAVERMLKGLQWRAT